MSLTQLGIRSKMNHDQAKAKKLIAIGYVRVSTIDQADHGVSIEDQADKIRMYVQLNDLYLQEIIIDAGKSGKNMKREGVQKVIDMTQSRDVQHLIVYRLDRLSRSVKDTLNFIDALDKSKVEFHSITDKIDTTTAFGKYFFHNMAAINQLQRDLISENTKSSLSHKKKNGKRAGQVPYGWQIEIENGRQTDNLQMCDEEQEVIKAIQSYRRNNYSYQRIADQLNVNGIQTRKGTKWQKQYIHNILTANPILEEH